MSLIPAAVLVPIIKRNNELTVLYTVRSQHVRNHKGQVSFPGGMAESTDQDRLATALREAEEEINLNPAQVSPLGYLPTVQSISGFEITPVVGLIESPLSELKADPKEVSEIFEVPLSFLLNHEHYDSMTSSETALYSEKLRFPYIRFERYSIWGVTADITKNLHSFFKDKDDFQSSFLSSSLPSNQSH